MSVTGKPGKGELDFFAYQWSVEEDNESTMIRCFGVTKENENVYVRIDNFTPYCYVELPTNIDWTESRIELVSNKLSNLNRKIYQPIKKEFVMRRKLYYAWKEKRKKKKLRTEGENEGKGSVSLPYKDKLFPFLFLAFRSSAALRNFTYSMKKDIDIPGLGRILFKLHEHEAGISPVLKLQALKKLPAAGMIRVKGIRIPDADKESTCVHEISCSYDNLFPIDTSEIIEPKVLSVDIEANSTITSAMPDASRPNDKVFQIGLSSLINKVRKKLLFSLGNPDPKKVGLDVELRTFKTEADLLVALTEYIHEEKFNIIIGYNILGWDFQYMISRAKYTKCMSEFDMMGMLMGEHAKEVAPSFESKAFNAQKLVYLDAEGRLFLDLLPIIKRSGEKLANYRLKTVTMHYGLPTKDPLTARDIFRCYREFTPDSLGVVGKYCVQDAYITLLLYEKLQTWYGLCEMAKTAHVPIFYLFSKGTQIQMFSQVMEYCMYNNYVIISNGYVMKEGDEYMGAIVLTPIPGKYKKVISFDFASLYPSIMMAHNIDYSTLIPEGEHYLVDKHDTEEYLVNWRDFPCYVKMSSIDMFDPSKNIEEWESVRNKSELQTKVEAMKEKYPGKLVGIFKEKSEIPDEHCHVFVWADHSACIHDMNRKKLKNGKFSTAKAKIICGQRYYRFMKAEYGGKGVVPTLLESLISRRKFTRADIKTNSKEIKDKLVSMIKNGGESAKEFLIEFEKQDKDLFCDIDKDVEKAKEEEIDVSSFIERIEFLSMTNQILDKRQASYKVCANSMYGAMGVKKGYLPLLPGASSITYKGRCSIEFISTYIPETYGGVTVYGDTDSSHIYFPHIKNNQDAVDLAEKIVKEIQVFFPLPMKLEFEKIYEEYIILTKKRYMARVANKKGEIIEFIKKGVMLSRRDNCITGDSLVTLANGTSIRIDNMNNNNTVLGWNGKGLVPSEQTNFKYQGEKECLQITLSDGRSIKCTPEHRLLVKNNDVIDWKQADKLDLTNDTVVCSIGSINVINYEKNWCLLPILDVKSIGIHKVYDISVAKTESFIANGIVVHNCDFARTMYLKAAESLLDDVPEYTILNDVIDGINSLFERKYGFKSFVITKSMARAMYKNKTLPAHVQLAYKMRTRGIEVPVGARIEYIFTTRCMGEKKFAQGDKVEDLDYFAQWRRYLRVDYLYYLDKQLIKPLDELLEVGLGIKGFVAKQYELRMNKWRITERIKELSMPNIIIEGEDEIDMVVPMKKKAVTKVKKSSPVKKEGKPKRKRARRVPEIMFDSDSERSDSEETVPTQTKKLIEIVIESDDD